MRTPLLVAIFIVSCFRLAAAQESSAPEPAPVGPHSCEDHPLLGGPNDVRGVTVIRFHIGTDGATHDVTVEQSSGHAALDNAGVSCVNSWKYVPATAAGTSVDVVSKARFDWDAPDDTGKSEKTSFATDISALEPTIHRLGVDMHLNGSLATILKVTTDGRSWRCRQIFLNIEGENGIRHWLSQGWDDPQDLVYAVTTGDEYVAVHVLADGTIVAAVKMNMETGIGTSLHFEDAKAFVKTEVNHWNHAKH